MGKGVIKYMIELTDEMLGTKPSSADVFSQFVASKKMDAIPKDEIDAAERAEAEIDGLEKSMTIFDRAEDGTTPIIWDYQVKGFFKDACGGLRMVPGTKSSEIKAYKKVIDTCIFVMPRKIALQLPAGTAISTCSRPLRAQTMRGDRVALAKSESVPAGTKIDITVNLLDPRLEKLIDEWIEYGQLRGLGQWRNSGKGRFVAVKI